MAKESGSSDFLAGFVVGGLVGATVSLLLTPRPGEETRAALAERSSGLRERLGDLSYPSGMEDFTGRAKWQGDELRERGLSAVASQVLVVQEVVESIQSLLQELLAEKKSLLQEAVQEGKQAASQTKEELLQKLETDVAAQGRRETHHAS